MDSIVISVTIDLPHPFDFVFGALGTYAAEIQRFFDWVMIFNPFANPAVEILMQEDQRF